MVLVIRKKAIFIALGCVALLLLIPLAARLMPEAAAPAAGGAVSWGLSFPGGRQPPVGNATADELLKYNAWYRCPGGEKVIYLTFDAGYENGHTGKILDTLKKHDVKAAFFLVGNYLDTAPELVKRMAAEGHLVGNHTLSHPDMSAIADPEAFKKELTGLEEKYRAITGGEMPKFYRPPQGKYSTANLLQAKALGYATVFWSLAYVDWYEDDQPTAQQAFDKLIPRIHPGAIVLLHSTSATNAEILDELLTRWKALGYGFGGLGELRIEN
ncbi:MAG: polysaccharide deacetylase family protein [Oscillospiraceae bacterium]|nr:polysaccharide deacetylase family protein [Oscillospiraceae bacterium]